MKTTRIFQEISRLDRRDFSKDDADEFVKYSSDTTSAQRQGLASKQKPLPGGSGLGYVFRNGGYSSSVHIFDGKKPVGLLTLDLAPKDIRSALGEKTLAIQTIGVEKEYEGRRIGLALYGVALTELGYTLLAGESQTPDGRRMWTKLNSIPGVEVGGYARIWGDSYASMKEIEKFEENLLKLSEEHGVEVTETDEGSYIAVFPVGIDPNGREMASMIAPFSVYQSANGRGRKPETGMYARWVG
jgi:hypothetical protein